jgi:hypothetical protein
MNPNQQQPQPQNTPAPLPEVPQVYPVPPAPVAESPFVEQPAVATPQAPEAVVENQPVAEPVEATTEAPVAPETVSEPVLETVVAQPVETPIQPASVVNEPVPVPVENQPLANSTFPVTPPTSPLDQFNLSETPVAAVLPIPQKKKPWLLIGLIAGGVVLLAALAVVLYVFVFNAGKISESDLVSSTTSGTSYLHPKQWQIVSVNSVDGYGDKKGKDGTSTAAIFVKKTSYVSPDVKKVSATELDKFRTAVLDSMTIASGGQVAKDAGSCTSVEDVTVMKSAVTTTNMVGVLRINATCTRDDGTFKVALYSTLGNDGYLRTIMLMSTESLWKQNEAIFNKMLDSADQS